MKFKRTCQNQDCNRDISNRHHRAKYCRLCLTKRAKERNRLFYVELLGECGVRLCLECKVDISARHRNAVRCRECAKKRTDKANRLSLREWIIEHKEVKVGTSCIDCGVFVLRSYTTLFTRCEKCARINRKEVKTKYELFNIKRYWHNHNNQMGTGRINGHRNEDIEKETCFIRNEFYRLGLRSHNKRKKSFVNLNDPWTNEIIADAMYYELFNVDLWFWDEHVWDYVTEDIYAFLYLEKPD